MWLISALLQVAVANLTFTQNQHESLPKAKAKKLKLTSKEKTIIMCLGNGLASKQIAEHLNLATATVNVHRLNIKKKLGLKSATALMSFAHNHINFEVDHTFNE